MASKLGSPNPGIESVICEIITKRIKIRKMGLENANSPGVCLKKYTLNNAKLHAVLKDIATIWVGWEACSFVVCLLEQSLVVVG